MPNRILWINPGRPPDNLNREFQQILDQEKRPDTVVEVVSTERGPRDLEYRYFEALVLPDVLHRIVRAEREGFDAAIIGCFYDPGLEAAKEVTRIIVTAPAEASMHIAATFGHRFSIIVGRETWVPQMMENVNRYGMKSHLASFRSIGLPVREMQADPAETVRRIRDAAQRAVAEDSAEVIILGCTMEYGLFREIQGTLGVPIIDPVLSAFKFAELLVELKKRYGWAQSKVSGYESPPAEQILQWGLQEEYGVDGLWEGTPQRRDRG